MASSDAPASGGCLCGAVRYEVAGPLRDVLVCHCRECQRWHGRACAATAAWREHLRLVEERGLRWIASPQSDAGASRGFCGECGSSLFWQAPARPTVSIAAGTLDGPHGLRTVGHIYVAQAGDYEALDDGVPRHPGNAPAGLVSMPEA
jgi:hypothetical protein